MIHAIGEGLIIAEIQQNSDTTYRVYDYDRGRELHIENALDVVDLSLKSIQCTGIKVEGNGFTKTYLCLSKDFSLELYDIERSAAETSDEERFHILTCVDGLGEIIYIDGIEKIKKGDSFIIPAGLGKYTLSGEMKILKSYVPNIKKVEEEILNKTRM